MPSRSRLPSTAPPGRPSELHAHRVVAAVDVQRRPRHIDGTIAQEVGPRGPDVVGRDVATQWRALLDDVLHGGEAGDRAGGERPYGAGRDGVDADVLLAE